MCEKAVRVENLGKCYQIGQAKSGDFRESFGGWMKRFSKRSKERKSESKEFWALKDINFEIKKGEAVGIIGSNGAGKSTLLKILSRITEPTSGRFEINGRVSSLLEVGTGFHPELSGRENIYLNGTILGMKRREIKAKFDEIVAFSGVEKFIDTPVKHYSSGMKVRLAFSVAAHLEPEILIIDEVLAVGDAEFQKKCLGKMGEVSKNEGRTVLFVSHNMGAVSKFCSKGILLINGFMELESQNIHTVIQHYLKSNGPMVSEWINSGNEFHNDYFVVKKFGIYNSSFQPVNNYVENNEEVWVIVKIFLKNVDPSLEIGYNVSLEDGEVLYWSYYYDSGKIPLELLKEGEILLKSKLPKRLLNNGNYQFNLIAGLRNRFWVINPYTDNVAVSLAIEGNLSESPLWTSKRSGPVAPVIKWEMELG